MLGASPVRLADVKFRGSVLVFAALAIQLGIYTTFTSHIPASWDRPLHVASYLMLVGFFVLNIRVPAFWLVGFGLLANVTAIFANGGDMPGSAGAGAGPGGGAWGVGPGGGSAQKGRGARPPPPRAGGGAGSRAPR